MHKRGVNSYIYNTTNVSFFMNYANAFVTLVISRLGGGP
jgi:hypothetical protein